MLSPILESAKFSRGLIERIYDYLFAQRYLAKGKSTVVDCFGGIGTGGIIGASRGIQWIGCELEPKFVALAEENFALHRRVWELSGDPQPRIVQGDSRKLVEVLGSVMAECVVSSPPYADVAKRERSNESWAIEHGKEEYGDKDPSRHVDGYGHSPGQLGAMKDAGHADAVVSSPPFEGCNIDNNENGVKVNRNRQCVRTNRPASIGKGQKAGPLTYGINSGQLGSGTTFWAASKLIVAQSHAILRPGGEPMPDGEGIEFCDG